MCSIPAILAITAMVAILAMHAIPAVPSIMAITTAVPVVAVACKQGILASIGLSFSQANSSPHSCLERLPEI
jgi:hypothetical protein